MKKYIYILSLLSAFLFFTSCEDQANDLFSGNSSDGEVYGTILVPLAFNYEYGNTPVIDFPIEVVGDIESYTVYAQLQTAKGDSEKKVFATGSTSEVITYTNTELFELLPINGVVFNDDSLQLGDKFAFSFEVKLAEFDNVSSLDSKNFSASFACPLGADFTGTYIITDVTGSPLVGSMFGDGVEVEVTETSTFGRQFEAVYGKDLEIGNGAVPIPFELLCGKVIVDGPINSGLACTSGILFDEADVNASFDLDDDSSFELTLSENTGGDCSSPTFQTTVLLTKKGE